jgi:hypothetical protein
MMGGGEGEKNGRKSDGERRRLIREGGRGILGCCDAEARNFTL